MSNVEESWYAVRVRNRNELAVSRHLSGKLKVQAFVPSHRIWKRKNGEKVQVSKPLLSTYVLIKANLSKLNYALFYSLGGIFGIVSQNGRPATIPEKQVLSLQKIGCSENPVYEIDFDSFKRDDRVLVVDGPLSGAVGNIINVNKDKGKFVVSLDLFKRAIVTELELDLVRPF